MTVVKMSDVAKAANVSVATVARVVHNKGYVSEENRRKINEVIKELGYVPNKIAQGLKNRQTKIIGHVLPYSYVNPFFVQVQGAIDKAAESRGYHVLTVSSQLDAKKEKKLIEDLVSRMVDGIIFTSNTALKPGLLEWLLNIGIHVVMVERPKNVIGIDKVFINNIEGSLLATSHIIEKGHRRIAFVGKVADEPVESGRFQGYEQAMKSAGIELVNEHIKFVPEYKIEYGYEAMKDLMEGGNPPSAVFMGSDLFACGAVQYLYKKNIRVPDDISLVGYDDSLAGLLSPPITSVAFPMDEIGKSVMDMMMERIVDNRINAKAVTLSPILVDRGSVKRLE